MSLRLKHSPIAFNLSIFDSDHETLDRPSLCVMYLIDPSFAALDQSVMPQIPTILGKVITDDMTAL